MFGIPKETINKLKREYPKGTRVELIFMEDRYSKLKVGEKGTVIVLMILEQFMLIGIADQV